MGLLFSKSHPLHRVSSQSLSHRIDSNRLLERMPTFWVTTPELWLAITGSPGTLRVFGLRTTTLTASRRKTRSSPNLRQRTASFALLTATPTGLSTWLTNTNLDVHTLETHIVVMLVWPLTLKSYLGLRSWMVMLGVEFQSLIWLLGEF